MMGKVAFILQIRDSRSITTPDDSYREKNSLKKLLDPIGGSYNAFSSSTDIGNEDLRHSIEQSLQGNLNFERMYYEPADSGGLRASLSWHLTQREIDGIEESMNTEEVEAIMNRIADWILED